MDDLTARPSAPPGWIEELEESIADIKAGRTVPLDPVLARIQASVDRMEARRSARQAKPTVRDG
jgi:hypothetical protein